MKTTVEIPDDLFRKAKSHAALQGIHLKDLVVRGLELALESPGPGRPFRQTFPIISGSAEQLVTSQDVSRALDLADREEAKAVAVSVRR